MLRLTYTRFFKQTIEHKNSKFNHKILLLVKPTGLNEYDTHFHASFNLILR
jgi:hypothetical protein